MIICELNDYMWVTWLYDYMWVTWLYDYMWVTWLYDYMWVTWLYVSYMIVCKLFEDICEYKLHGYT
jgi:hypothetical protein